MAEWSVILSVPVEFEFVVEAEDEAEARLEALDWYKDAGFNAAQDLAESTSIADPEVIDAWEVNTKGLEEDLGGE